MIKIIDIEYIQDYIIRLTFDNGMVKNLDLQPYLTGDVFGPLKDKSKFTQYCLTPRSIEWYNGADFAPEFLYQLPDIK